MSKRIYFFINDEDLLDLLNFFAESGIIYHSDKKFKSINSNIVNVKITCRESSADDQRCIWFCPSVASDAYTSDACIVLDDESEIDKNLVAVFSKIKKYIRSHYTISKNKAYYIGPGIYQDWLKRKIRLPVLLDYEEVVIREKELDLKKFFECIINEGYYVKVNFAKLRNINVLDLTADAFIIYESPDKIIQTVINRNMIRYENDSECIFIYKTKRRKETEFSFLLDKRILKNSSSKLVLLLDKLRDKLMQI